MRHKGSFETQVIRCRADVAKDLPAIAARHSPLALLGALAEHVGGALKLMMQRGSCTPEQARVVLERVKQTAFEGGD